MSDTTLDSIKLSPLEAAVLRNLRQMDQRARGEMLKITALWVEAHPLTPPPRLLRLVHSSS